jgi:HEAT repeat protein
MHRWIPASFLLVCFGGAIALAAPPAGDDALLAALRTEDEQARLEAIDALATRGAKIPGAVAALAEQFKDRSPRVRVRAAAALGELGPAARPAAARLAPLLVDENIHVRRMAIRTLRRIHPDPSLAVPLLVEAIGDADMAVRLTAMDGLAEVGKAAVPALSTALTDDKAAYNVCLALGEIGGDAAEAVPALAERLKQERRSDLRRELILTLGAIGAPAADTVPQLRQALGDIDPGVRLAAVFTLGRIGPKAGAASDGLRRFTTHPTPLLRTLSIWALARVNPDDEHARQKAVAALLEALGGREPRVRAMASRALVDLHADPQRILPALGQMLDARGAEVLDDVLNVLASMGEPAVPLLERLLRMREARARAARLLGRVGPGAKAALPALGDLITCEDAAVRREAILAIGAMGSAAGQSVPAIIEAMHDANTSVRYSACYALGQIGQGASAAQTALQKEIDGADPLLALVSAWALARIEPDCAHTTSKALPQLMAALDDPEPMVRLEAATSLRCLGPRAKAAAPMLARVAREDPSDLIREMAGEALQTTKE